MTHDNLQKFMFENAAVRGELVELSHTWQQVRTRRAYPLPVQTILGQLMAAAALLSANLKFDGTMILQLHGDGPVKLLVVECTSDMHLRATAKLAEGAEIDPTVDLNAMVNQHGKGRFVITLEPNKDLPGQQTYQGVVPLDGSSDIATVLENYMLRSEQLDTKIILAANDQVARGLMLQKLPQHGGIEANDPDQDAWQRATTLAGTLHEPELLATPIQHLLHRLFWEETLRVFEPMHPVFRCTCSRERVGKMLLMLGKPEVESALAELGSLGIDCDFCGMHYAFDPVDCAQLFAQDAPVETLLPVSEVKH
jgi:molecular chaperone Hsp33